KEGAGWVILRIANKVFVMKPIGTAKEVVDHLWEDGLIKGIPGSAEALGSAVALPAIIGATLGWIRAGGVTEKKGVVTVTFGSKIKAVGRGAKSGALWKYHVVKWSGKKVVVK